MIPLEEILPPTPPSAPTSQKENNTITTDEPLLPPTTPDIQKQPEKTSVTDNNKKGFLSRLFTKTKTNQPIPETFNDDTSSVNFEVPDADVNSDDLANIRQALGLKDEEKKTFGETTTPIDEQINTNPIPVVEPIKTKKQKEQKNKAEVQEKALEPTKEEFPEDSLELPPPPDQDIDKDAQTFVDQISPLRKAKPEVSARYEKKQKQKKDSENYFSDLNQQLEKTKNDLVQLAKEKKAKLGKPLTLTTKEERAFTLQLKKTINAYESKTTKKLNVEKAKLKRDTEELLKEIKMLDQREAKLKKIETKHNEREQRVNNEKKRLEDLKDVLNDQKTELDDLSSSLVEQKEQHDKLVLQNKNLQRLTLEKKHKLEAKDKENKLLLKEYDIKIAKADKDYQALQSKSNLLIKTLKSREDTLKQKEKEVKGMLDEERKLFDYLQGAKPENIEAFKKSILEEPKHEEKSILEESTIINEEPKVMPNLDMRSVMQIAITDENPLQEKVDDCKELVQEGNLDDAKLLYNDLRKEFLDSNNLNEDEKDKLKHELRELYDEIALGLLRGK